jgi:hypothetical protein
VAAIPAQRATWDAERTRLAGPSDPDAWGTAAGAWQDLGCPHRAGYAWWRKAELYISPRTAGVHVSNILRKLGVSGRVQAATLAERAGLLHPGH